MEYFESINFASLDSHLLCIYQTFIHWLTIQSFLTSTPFFDSRIDCSWSPSSCGHFYLFFIYLFAIHELHFSTPGDVVLENLELKSTALSELNLPVVVHRGGKLSH